MGIRDFVKQISPPWLIGSGVAGSSLPTAAGVAERLMFSISTCSDLIVEKINQAILMRFPGKGDPSSLPQVGGDRGITRGFAESDGDYATRLQRWLDTWRHAGSARGVLEAIAGYVGVAPKIQSILEGPSDSVWDIFEENADSTGAPATRHESPPNWTWDVLGYVKRRWLVIMNRNVSTGETWVTSTRKWGDGSTWGGTGNAWGVDLPADVGRSIVEIIRTWKGAGTRYWWCVINFDDLHFDFSYAPGNANNPDTKFDSWSKIDTSGVRPRRVRSRFTTAKYFQGPRT